MERLLASLPEGVPTGMFERKRLEHVLRAAGMPQGAGAFAAWMEEDRERLARLVTAVVGTEPGHRRLVGDAVAAWWAEEGPRWERAETRAIEPRKEPEAQIQPGGGAWTAVLVIALVAVGLLIVWLLVRPVPPIEPTTSGESSVTSEAGNPATEGSTSGGASDESDGGSTSEASTGTTTTTSTTTTSTSDVPEVRVPGATLEVVPGEGVIPWSPIVIAVLAAAAFVLVWRIEPPVGPRGPPEGLPRPLVHRPQPTSWGRVPPRGRPLRRVLLERGDRDALVGGIAREVSERLTDVVDVPRSVDVTIETDIPTLCFVPAQEHRGVWIWRDLEMVAHGSLAVRLEHELAGAMREAGLPLQVAGFDGVPSTLLLGRQKLAVASLEGVGRPPRVVVLTDGDRLRQWLGDASMRASTEATLRLMRRWDGLAVVDFGGERSDLAMVAREWHLQRITPQQAAAHLAGQVSREGLAVASRDRLRWAAVCAIVPRAIAEEEAQRVRGALGLRASPFEIDALGARRRGRDRLEWSGTARVEVLARYERGYGYLRGWPRGGATLLRAAIRHWVALYDREIESRGAGDRSDTKANLEIERAMLQLWGEPEDPAEATRAVERATEVLYERWQDDALRDVVTEILSQHTDANGPLGRVRLPWTMERLTGRAKWMLEEMGLAVGQQALEEGRKVVPLSRGGRRALGLGLAAGIAVGGVGVGVLEVMRPRVKVAHVGKAPEGASVACRWDGEMLECEVQSRHAVEVVRLEAPGSAAVVRVSWAMEERACEGALEGGGRYVMCDREGKLARQAKGLPVWSRAVVVAPAARVIAQALLDSGTIDYAVIDEAGRGGVDLLAGDGARVLGGGGQRLVIVGEGVEGTDGPALVVRAPEGWVPSLGFVGTQTVVEAWPEVTVVSGDGRAFELRGVLTPSCPAGTIYIDGGSFDGHEVGAYCLDSTEVTVAAYQACVERGGCTAADDRETCNSGKADRLEHPINCVDWNQATAFCEVGGGRLPTEWEWEWAARGRDEGRTYPWGEEAPTCEYAVMDESASMDDKRWGCDTSATWPVGKKSKGNSRDGVMDMAGNVWEWTSTESESGESRFVRGGSWIYDDPQIFRASSRGYVSHPASRDDDVGFRCARTTVRSK